jgi:hypothetical protein
VKWTWANDTPLWLQRTVYFIVRKSQSGVEYLRDKRGRIRLWRSRKAVKKALRNLEDK